MNNPWDRDLTIEDFPRAGRRVAMHPCTDWWMRGDRFGTVTKVDKEAGLLSIRLDVSRKTIKTSPRNVDGCKSQFDDFSQLDREFPEEEFPY